MEGCKPLFIHSQVEGGGTLVQLSGLITSYIDIQKSRALYNFSIYAASS